MKEFDPALERLPLAPRLHHNTGMDTGRLVPLFVVAFSACASVVVDAGYAPGCTVPLTVGVESQANAIAIQPDGRIVVVGFTDIFGDRDFLVARFMPDLSLDPTFGSGAGYVFTNFDRDDEALGVAIQTDGKIVVVGYAVNNGSGTQSALALARYERDGTLDASFVGGGAIMYVLSGSQREELHSVALQPDGKIVAVGFHETFGPRTLLVSRFFSDGSDDTGFDGVPVIGDASEGHDLFIARDGSILVAGTATFTGNNDVLAAKFRTDGTLDPAFNGVGWNSTDIANPDDAGNAIAVDSSGRVIVAGTSSADISLARYRADGLLDGSFGAGGTRIHDIGTDAGNDLALDASGNLVVVGEGGSADFALTRFTPAGSNTLSVANDIVADDRAFALAIRRDGKFLVAGTTAGPSNPTLTLALFNPDGTQDCSVDVLHPFGNRTSGFAPFGPGPCTNWQCVNDNADAPTGPAAPHDALTSYVSSAAATTRDLYTLVDGALPVGKVVTEIEVVAHLQWGGTGASPSIDFLYQRNGFDAVAIRSATQSVSNTTFQEFRHRFAGLNWNAAELDALDVGVEHVAGNDLQMTQLYVVVTYGDSRVYPVEPFTAGTTGAAGTGSVTLNWLNPRFGLYGETVVRRSTTACPSGPNADDLVVRQTDGLGQAGAYTDSVPIGPTYFYAAFVEDAEDHASPGVCLTATPFDRDALDVDWIYSTSDPAPALSTPGLRATTGIAYTVTNNRIVHAITGGSGGTGGGSWPAGWKPFRLGAKAASRPPVVQLTSGGAWAALFAAEDGHVYAIDAATGDLIWRSPKLGMMLASSPAAMLEAFGSAHNFVFIGTRDAGAPNRLYALNAADGTVAWFFDNGGTAIGLMTKGPAVSYADERVYFTSFSGTSPNTVWCLDFTISPFTSCGSWPDFGKATSTGGDVDVSPTLYNGLVLVADDLPGESLYGFDPANGTELPLGFIGGGSANDYVFPRFSTTDVIVSNASEVQSFNTAGPSFNWTCPVSSPSAPLQVPGTNDIYVGGGDGRLHRLSTISGCTGAFECLGSCSSTVGSPAYDVLRTMIYVGTIDGEVYGVKTPF